MPGTTLRMILHCERFSAAALHHSPKQMDGPDPPVLKGCSQALRFLRGLAKNPSFFRRAPRAPRVSVRPSSPGPLAATSVTASRSAPLRKPPLLLGGLGKECTLGRKLHFSFTQRRYPHRFQALAHCERVSAAALHHSPKQMDGPDPPVLTGCSQALRFCPRSCQKSLFRSARAARASCSRETLIPRAPCSNICYRVSLRSLAETSVAAGEPRERVHTRAKIAF